MSIPKDVADQLLVDCLHRCCKCKVAGVQIHHIRYISADGDNTYDNLIPLCQKCHTEVHVSQQVSGLPGITVRAITRDQLKLYKKQWIEYCKNFAHIKMELTEPSQWHYYYHHDRINSIWNTLADKSLCNYQPDVQYLGHSGFAKQLIDIERYRGFYDLTFLLEKIDSLEELIGTFVTIKGRFNSNVKAWGYYSDLDAEWDKETPANLDTLIKVNENDFQITLELNPNYVTTVSSFLKLKQDPYLQVIGHVYDANSDSNLIKISPLNLCPKS